MAVGARDSDAYLAEWRRGAPEACGDDLAAEADKAVAAIVAGIRFEPVETADRRRRQGLIAPCRSTAPSQPPNDALVLFMPSGRRGRFAVGTPVLDAARSLGVYVESVCGGRGICGRCQVRAGAGRISPSTASTAGSRICTAVNEVEQRYAELRRCRPTGASPARRGSLATSSSTSRPTSRSTPRWCASAPRRAAIERDIAIRLYPVEVDPPDMHKPLGDLDRLIARLVARARTAASGRATSSLLPRIQTILRKGNFEVTAVVHHDGEGRRCCSMCGRRAAARGCSASPATSARRRSPCISSRCCRAASSASAGTSNPQIRFGEDLMSRVSYVMMNPDGREAMTKAVRDAVNALIDQVCEEGGVDRTDILDSGVRRQSDHAPPVPRHRPDRARPGAVRARRLRRAAVLGARDSASQLQSRRRASTCCPASPAMSAPMPPARRCPKARTARTR